MPSQTNVLADAQALLAQMKASNDTLQKDVDDLVDNFDQQASRIGRDFERTENKLVAINEKFLSENEADIAKTSADVDLLLKK